MTELQIRGKAEVVAGLFDPRDDWPFEARALRDELLQTYGTADMLPDVAGGWIARWPSVNTRCTYARGFRVCEEYVRGRGGHVLAAGFPLADAFARHLETAPTLHRVRGGRCGEMAPTGKPRSDASRANLLSACSSFYTHTVHARAAEADPWLLRSWLPASAMTAVAVPTALAHASLCAAMTATAKARGASHSKIPPDG
ncbi:hypothetical protein ACIQ7Q_33715 [Streptomyces sp. NPDC096176]|uniref:hypothetical protein n=1 Tax=Streptomyces sp. NPDC096176 TaxID=3366079 RepID=UPI003826FC39